MNFCFRREFYMWRIYALLYSFFLVNFYNCSWVIEYIPLVLSVFMIATEISPVFTSLLSLITHSFSFLSEYSNWYLFLLLLQLALSFFEMKIDSSEHPFVSFSYIFLSRNYLFDLLLFSVEVVMMLRHTGQTWLIFLKETALLFVELWLQMFMRFSVVSD